jgi:hypothetical protein
MEGHHEGEEKEIKQKMVNAKCEWVWHTHLQWLGNSCLMFERCVCVRVCVCVCVYCAFQNSQVQLDAVSSAHLVFLMNETMHKQHEIHIMLKLFSDTSIVLEQICIFKTRITVELSAFWSDPPQGDMASNSNLLSY